jgi:hypothetical protein
MKVTQLRPLKRASELQPIVKRASEDRSVRRHARHAADSMTDVVSRVRRRGMRRALEDRRTSNQLAGIVRDLSRIGNRIDRRPSKKRRAGALLVMAGAAGAAAALIARRGNDSAEIPSTN